MDETHYVPTEPFWLLADIPGQRPVLRLIASHCEGERAMVPLTLTREQAAMVQGFIAGLKCPKHKGDSE